MTKWLPAFGMEQAEYIAKLLDEIERLNQYRKSGQCSWCGDIFKGDDYNSREECLAALLEHARNCEGHPAVRECKRLKAELENLQSLKLAI